MLLCIPDVLDPDELAHLRGLAASAPWAGGLSAGPQAALAKHNLQIPEDAPLLAQMRSTVMRALNRSTTLLSAALPLKVLPPNFNRYVPGHSHYGPHADNTLRWLPDGSCLRTDISATLFLSAPGDYEGGELCIQQGQTQSQVKLDAGSLAVYPSGAIHEVRPVTHGERVGCYLFMQSVVRDADQRQHLYDMDCALRGLRARVGEADADVIRLTGSYHALLRRWAEC